MHTSETTKPARAPRRARWILAAATALAAALVGASPGIASGATTSSWQQADFNAGRTRFNPNETALSRKTVGTLHVAWRLKGDGNCTPWFGTVAYGLVYVGACDSPVGMTAYDPVTGHVRWHAWVPGQDWTAGPPAIADGRLFVVTHDVDTLVALDAHTGKLLWSVDQNLSNYFESPAVANGVVIAGREAFNAATGKKLWGIPWNDAHKCGSGLTTDIAVTISGNSVYMRCGDGSLETRDLMTGALRSIRPSTTDGSTPVVVGGVMYYGSAGRLVARNAATGTLRWQAAAGKTVGQPAIGNGFAVAVVDGRKVQSFDLATGRSRWIRDLATNVRAPAVANGIVYVRTPTSLRALDAATGAVLRSVTTRNNGADVMAIANGMVFTGSEALSL